MKKFIVRITAFLLLLVFFISCLDVFLSKYIKKSNSYAIGEYPTWNAIFDGKVDSDIVIYGNSRAWQHFDSSMIEESLKCSTFNLGINGHPFLLQYLRHKLLLKHNPKPKLIIQSVDDTGTFFRRDDLHNPDQMLPYMLWNEEIHDATISMKGYSSYDYYLPLTRYSGKLDAIKASFKMFLHPKSNKIIRIKGFQGVNESWGNKSNINNTNALIDNSIVILFDKYLSECRKKNILVVLVYSPEYIERQKRITNRSVVVNLYKQFSLKYNIPFIDFSDSEISHKQNFFYDGFHMNKVGAEIFTKELIQKLKEDKRIKCMLASGRVLRKENLKQ